MPALKPIRTALLERLVTRMQRTHDRRRSSFFVGPPGIGKSTAVEAFRLANPREVMVTRVLKRGVTGPQALQQLLLSLNEHRGNRGRVDHSMAAVQHRLGVVIEEIGGGRRRDEDADEFPFVTVVFDEAQRLTNSAIDALRDYNEPHYFCRGTFPIGMIFVGNNELSLEATNGGASIIDEGMQDRLLFRDRLSYEDIERPDIEAFTRAAGIEDDGAVAAIVTAFSGPRVQRSFRRISDFIDEVRDEAGDQPVKRETVRTVLTLI